MDWFVLITGLLTIGVIIGLAVGGLAAQYAAARDLRRRQAEVDAMAKKNAQSCRLVAACDDVGLAPLYDVERTHVLWVRGMPRPHLDLRMMTVSVMTSFGRLFVTPFAPVGSEVN